MKNWKQIEISGERYFLRPTFDIVDYIGGVHGFDVYDERGDFLTHYDVDIESEVISQIILDFYRVVV